MILLKQAGRAQFSCWLSGPTQFPPPVHVRNRERVAKPQFALQLPHSPHRLHAARMHSSLFGRVQKSAKQFFQESICAHGSDTVVRISKYSKQVILALVLEMCNFSIKFEG